MLISSSRSIPAIPVNPPTRGRRQQPPYWVGKCSCCDHCFFRISTFTTIDECVAFCSYKFVVKFTEFYYLCNGSFHRRYRQLLAGVISVMIIVLVILTMGSSARLPPFAKLQVRKSLWNFYQGLHLVSAAERLVSDAGSFVSDAGSFVSAAASSGRWRRQVTSIFLDCV